jgi:hypothetical protein
MNRQDIYFPNGNHVQAVIAPDGTPAADLLHALDIPQPHALIMIAGGAAFMDKQSNAELEQLFTGSVVQVASQLNALIIDGGTQAGVMEIIGLAVSGHQQRPQLLGVSPHGNVTYPGKSSETSNTDSGPLDPNHSHFVLVETDEWGGETATMYALAAFISKSCPSLAILVNGGAIAENEIINNVRQQRPIIVIEGSGRLADEIARLWQAKPTSTSNPIADAALAEIIREGDLYLFPITSSAVELAQIVRHLLDQR